MVDPPIVRSGDRGHTSEHVGERVRHRVGHERQLERRGHRHHSFDLGPVLSGPEGDRAAHRQPVDPDVVAEPSGDVDRIVGIVGELASGERMQRTGPGDLATVGSGVAVTGRSEHQHVRSLRMNALGHLDVLAWTVGQAVEQHDDGVGAFAVVVQLRPAWLVDEVGLVAGDLVETSDGAVVVGGGFGIRAESVDGDRPARDDGDRKDEPRREPTGPTHTRADR